MVNVLPQLIQLKGAALDLLFPRFCVGCGREGDFICNSCLTSLARIEPPVCPKCGRPQKNYGLCSSCLDWQSDIDGIRSPFKFEGVMRKAIHDFKYRNLRAITVTLARLLNDYLVANPIPCDVLVPVPLHDKRVRERGYNQSSLLAGELGKLTGLPVNEDCLARVGHNLPQAKTGSVEERRQNVKGIFICRNNILKDRDVLLIDDVATSGATLNACAAALKEIGVPTVWGLTLAREI
ncbi:MAG: ComF family protein [Dehalococcoidales bacterium]|nr:ComF family protein [Dehalococcoidales bacterium]